MQSRANHSKRILIFSTSEWAGPYIKDLVTGLSEKGFEVIYFSLRGKLRNPIPESPLIRDESCLFDSNENLTMKLIKVIRSIRKFKPDLIQTHFFHAGFLGVIASKFNSVPVILTRHHIDEIFLSGKKFLYLLDSISTRLSTHTIVTSLASKKWLIETEKCKPNKISVVNQGFKYNFDGLSNNEKHLLSRELGFSKTNFNILCVCRYSPGKGQDFLLASFEILKRNVDKVHLTFIGHGDPNPLRKLVEKKNLSESITVLSERQDIAKCIFLADVVAHPSLVDSFSQLIIEAQSLQRPIVAFDIAAAREQIIDGQSGFIVKPRDYEAMAEKLQILFDNKKLRKEMGKKGFKHVTSTYTYDRMIRETIAVFENFLN